MWEKWVGLSSNAGLTCLMRAAIGTHNIDNCSRVCHSPTGYGLKTTFGTSACV